MMGKKRGKKGGRSSTSLKSKEKGEEGRKKLGERGNKKKEGVASKEGRVVERKVGRRTVLAGKSVQKSRPEFARIWPEKCEKKNRKKLKRRQTSKGTKYYSNADPRLEREEYICKGKAAERSRTFLVQKEAT